MADANVLNTLPDGLCWRFRAMASPCEARFDTDDSKLAGRLGALVEEEAARIETKFSRYLPDSVISRINAGGRVEVDAETAALLDYADGCFKLSKGRFDITSGVLRRLWRFDGTATLPSETQTKAMRKLVGWRKIGWKPGDRAIELPEGMEIDFGGIGKEYAVDSAVQLLVGENSPPFLVNFGGDLRVSGPRRDGSPWRVALESVDTESGTMGRLELSAGALTTSGDKHRSMVVDGKRYGHILDPRSCRPVADPPRSVTVAAPTCLQAGILSTLAMLHGKQAERFIEREGIRAWWVR
jgi:thiamine biosynthesis lipoprotein